MIWDAPLVAAAGRELHSLLEGRRLRSHRFLWEERRLELFFRSLTLRWHLHPGKGWVTEHPAEAPPEDARPLSADVVGVEAPPDERLLRIHLRRRRGRTRRVTLMVELMTNQWNALLLEGKAETIRHLLRTRRLPGRTLSIGEEYRPPAPSDRKGARGPLRRGEWLELVEEKREAGRPEELLRELAFTSPVNLPALLAPDSGPERKAGEPLAGYPLWVCLGAPEDPEPHLLETRDGPQSYPYPLQGLAGHPQPSLLHAIAVQARETGEGTGTLAALLERADRALHRARGRIRGLERELAEAEDPAELRDRANLLLARLTQVPSGADRVRVQDFTGGEVEIPLDPALSPHENADALYEEAARRERALESLPRLIAETGSQLEELEDIREGLESGDLPPGEAESLLPPAPGTGAGRAEAEETRLPYRRYRSSGGLEIRVGRRGADNDDLTFHHSRPDHIWLHAREVSGAHVILCWEGDGSPPPQDLAEAATLAALGSRARNAGVVPVDWTRRKYVRKPRKAPPGAVVPDRVQTVFVEPTPGLEERLAREE